MRGDWFVTSGEELGAEVSIVDAHGNTVYHEGPRRPVYDEGGGAADEEPAAEGSFRFALEAEGILRVSVSNPSEGPRTVTLAWLKGRDEDDAFTAGEDAEGGGGGAAWGDDGEPVDAHGEALMANPRNASAFAKRMLGRVSRLHKAIDGLVAQQAYADVLAKRAASTLVRVQARVNKVSLIQALVVIAVAVLQVLAIRRFDLKLPGSGMHAWV